jgi:hypothetical protein
MNDSDLGNIPAGYFKTTRDWVSTLEQEYASKLYKEF